MTKVDTRNETASNHYKQTQMGGLGDGSESGKTREINKFYFHMHFRLASHRLVRLQRTVWLRKIIGSNPIATLVES
jgi:hypothetical protein